jgi:hypothetical protein
MCDLNAEARDPKLGRDTPSCHDTRIGSEVTVRTRRIVQKVDH